LFASLERFNALIPARAGSKGVINKNLMKVGTRSITHRALDLASSWRFHKIILSTDIDTLIDEEFNDKRIIKHRRPDFLCTDDATMEGVVMDAIESQKLTSDDWMVLLQPTCPFRVKGDIDLLINILERTNARSLISVTPVGGAHPERMYTKIQDSLRPLKYTSFSNRQTLKDIFIRNGAFYVFMVGDFLAQRSFYIHPCVGYEMDKERSINIDNELDLILARQLA